MGLRGRGSGLRREQRGEEGVGPTGHLGEGRGGDLAGQGEQGEQAEPNEAGQRVFFRGVDVGWQAGRQAGRQGSRNCITITP